MKKHKTKKRIKNPTNRNEVIKPISRNDIYRARGKIGLHRPIIRKFQTRTKPKFHKIGFTPKVTDNREENTLIWNKKENKRKPITNYYKYNVNGHDRKDLNYPRLHGQRNRIGYIRSYNHG